MRVNVSLNPLNFNPTKWSNTLKQFVGKLPTNCLSVVDHFMGLALTGLTEMWFPLVILKNTRENVKLKFIIMQCH